MKHADGCIVIKSLGGDACKAFDEVGDALIVSDGNDSPWSEYLIDAPMERLAEAILKEGEDEMTAMSTSRIYEKRDMLYFLIEPHFGEWLYIEAPNLFNQACFHLCHLLSLKTGLWWGFRTGQYNPVEYWQTKLPKGIQVREIVNTQTIRDKEEIYEIDVENDFHEKPVSCKTTPKRHVIQKTYIVKAVQ
jgi:hypothetical protein